MRKTIFASDLSGNEIRDYAHVTIVAGNRRWELDAEVSEIGELISNAREVKKRGRRPKRAETIHEPAL